MVEDVIDLFSTYWSIDDRDRVVRHSDPRLRRNMERLVDLDNETSVEFWDRFFINNARMEQIAFIKFVWCDLVRLDADRIRSSVLFFCILGLFDKCYKNAPVSARRHLIARLHRPCYFASSGTYKIFGKIRKRYSKSDHFQIAVQAASEPLELLKKFDSNLSSLDDNYVIKILKGKIADTLNKDEEAKFRKYSKWYKLKHISKSALEKYLNAKYPQNTVTKCMLIWQAFKEFYKPTTMIGCRKFEKPSNEEIGQIARLSHQKWIEMFSSKEAINDKEVETCLEICIQVVVEAKKYTVIDYEGDKFETSMNSDVGKSSSNSLDDLAHKEQNDWIYTVLSESFAKLSNKEQKILLLWLGGFKVTQSQIAQLFKLKQQYQVTRLWQRCRRTLLRELAQWTKDNPEVLGVVLNNDALQRLNEPIKDWVKDWVENHCQTLLLNWRQNIDVDSLPLKKIKQYIQEKFIEYVTIDLDIDPNALPPVRSRINAFIEHWLQNTNF